MPSRTPPTVDIGPWRGLVRVQGAVRRELGRTAFRRARKAHLAHVNRCFLDRCTPQERAVLSQLWERLLPGSTT